MTAAALQERLQSRSVEMVGLAEKNAANWQRLSQQIEQRILRLLEAEANRITPAESARILSEIRSLLGSGAKAAMKQADREALKVLEQSFAAQSEYFASAYNARSAFAIRSERVARVFRYYDNRIQSGEFLRGEYWKRKRVDWGQDFIDRHKDIRKTVQRRMTQSMATGEQISTRDLAAGLKDQVGRISGQMPAEQWAKGYARTEYGQLYNEFSEQIATQAGVEKFVNIGVSDERQSRECYEASQEKPKTMLEWDAWRASNGGGGRPGTRHVFNCRCIAGAVPDALEDDDWTQPNEKYEEATV